MLPAVSGSCGKLNSHGIFVGSIIDKSKHISLHVLLLCCNTGVLCVLSHVSMLTYIDVNMNGDGAVLTVVSCRPYQYGTTCTC